MAATVEARRTGTLQLVLAAMALLAVLCGVGPASAFNVDVDNIMRYTGRYPEDMFGFSVALHKEARTRESWVLVGAPEAQSERQRAVRRGGAVYRCDISQGRCSEVPFDQSDGNNRNATYHDIDNKSHQWFGATVAAAQSGSAVVACAPRYVYYPNTRDERHDPVGTCWVARDQFGRFNEYSPCRTSEWGYHRKGHCQAGLGASISEDGRQLFIGAPGSHYWQGQLFTVDATVFMPFLPPESFRTNSTSGQVFAENLHRRPEVYETLEGPSTDDDTYLGYSVAVGYFEGHGNTTVAVGRPRGDHLKGKVEIYSWNLSVLVDISGDQLGSYFGYSLCASDIDGDGYDDLVVGAPLYTEPNNEGKYETGQIYVFYQNEEYEKNDTRDGINSRSRFGLSLSSLGDINKDGYGDIAVGAPYDNPEGRGAVYIYLGSAKGIREKPSQIIYANQVSGSLSTFGFSVSGGLDLDNNEYPDLVVGAYESNSAAFFRARPIVKVDATVEFLNTTRKQINLKSLNCAASGSSKNDSICFVVKSCLRFNGIGVDNWHDFNIQVLLDAAKSRSPRIFFRDFPQRGNSRNFTARATKNSLYCRDFNVFIKSNLRDKLTPLEVEMRYTLQSTRGHSRYLAPVLDLALPPVKKDTLHIAKNCGSDNICIPDLKMEIEPSVEQYLLGTGEDFKLAVFVENKGEDAFEATYNLQIPKGLNYVNIVRLDKNQDVTVQCSPPTPASNNTLLCDIGNPLPARKHVKFNVLMQPFYTEVFGSRYNFEMEVNSTNPEKLNTKEDNKISLEIPISIQTDLSLMGASYPSDVHWNSIDYSKTEGFTEEKEIGPQVVHVHTIHNRGPADIVEAEVFIVVPTSTFAGDNLLYILEQPETEGPIKCQKVPQVNFLHLKLDKKRTSYIHGQEKLSGSDELSVSKESSSSASSSSSSSSSSQDSISGHDQRSRSGGSTNEDEAPSEGGRRGGGSATQVTYHGRGNTHNLVGINEGRTIHKDEGVSGKGTFGQSGSEYGYQHSSQNFQNSSQVSRRVETHSGGSGPVVHSSTNFSASWSENGGPLHHYQNHTSEGDVHRESSVTHHNGRDQSGLQQEGHASGGRIEYNSSRHHSSSSNTNTDQSGRGYYDNSGVYHSNTGGYSNTGVQDNAGVYRDNRGRTHYSAGGQSGSGGWTYENSSSVDSTHYRNQGRTHYGSASGDHGSQGGYYGSTGGYHDNSRGYNDNEEDYHDNDGYHESEGSYHNTVHESGESRRQDNNTSQGVFRHYPNTWSSSGSEQRNYNSERGVHLSSGSETIGRDNVNEGMRHVDGQYGNLDHRSQGRTHQYSGSDSTGDSSHSSSGHYSTSNVHDHSSSNRGQSGTSYSQDQNYRGGSQDNDASRNPKLRQYFSTNWETDQGREHDNRNRGTDSSHSRSVSGSEQRVHGYGSQELSGGGQFYTSSVLLGSDGNPDLGYAARGHAQQQDSFSSSSSNSRHHSSGGRRKSVVDPDLADLGAQFTDRPDVQNQHHTARRDEDEDGQLRLYERYKRSSDDNTLEKVVKCNATNCTKIHCTLGRLSKGGEVRIVLRMRAWVPTMKKLKDDRIIKTSSLMALQVTSLPYIGKPHETIIRDHEVFTDIVSTDSPTIPDIVPLWVVVLSAVAGTIILLLLIFLLWKCGFFKRNRPADSAEKEPLNRNGHYSAGDEAL